ncbi:hypothetical protein T484DRAFT_3288582 [Baffinella frigidus]|nr:hypothetical protein T484DRAFT_3288582 [Cryptophyta sp. CCMP2293]
MVLVQNGLISILVVQILSTFAIKGYSGLAASPLQGGKHDKSDADLNAPCYVLSDIYATITKCQINDNTYFSSIQATKITTQEDDTRDCKTSVSSNFRCRFRCVVIFVVVFGV